MMKPLVLAAFALWFPPQIGAVFAQAVSTPNADSPNPSRPNVLFIAVDDMRCDLNCYGNSQVISPHIDSLASHGTLFTRAYCQQAVCNPSRASLLTGLRCDTLRIWDLPTHFRKRFPDVVTLPQHFKNHGYQTVGYGKIFHNWRQDEFRGDQVSWSRPQTMHYARHGDDHAQLNIDGKIVTGVPVDQHSPDTSRVPRTEIRDVPDDAYFDGRIANLAADELRRLAHSDGPFFLGVGFWKPHAHFNAPKKYWDMYDADSIRPAEHSGPPKNVPSIAMHDSREILRAFKSRPGGKPSVADSITLRHGYFAAITYADAQIGKVLHALEETGLEKNTLVVFWSDHGFHLGEHGLWAKTSNFELDARVPLIIKMPDHDRLSQRSSVFRRTDRIVELLDLYPTLSELCGLPIPSHVEGVSRASTVLGSHAQTKESGHAVTWHPRPAYPAQGKNPDAIGWSVRTDRYRYTQWLDFETGERKAEELYDHKDDPNETVNLAAESASKSIVLDHRKRVLKRVRAFHRN